MHKVFRCTCCCLFARNNIEVSLQQNCEDSHKHKPRLLRPRIGASWMTSRTMRRTSNRLTESVDVKEYAPFILTYIATMFFGVQFESIDRRFSTFYGAKTTFLH